tara:strand:- start:66535 stop:66708 length:174 start_codon:yes stop_codon:yes gene_type:complete
MQQKNHLNVCIDLRMLAQPLPVISEQDVMSHAQTGIEKNIKITQGFMVRHFLPVNAN